MAARIAKDWDVERYEAGHSYVWTFGRGVLDWLKPQPGERILDAGCGAGQLSAEIAASCATVLGIDSAPSMIAQARANYPAALHPNLEFALADLSTYISPEPFDAVFSNAVLHWIRPPLEAAKRMAGALRSKGRLVVEFGGHGNVETIQSALGGHRYPWFFPSIAEYCGILESAGLEPVEAILFDRPTKVEGANGMDDWLQMYIPGLNASVRAAAVEQLRSNLFREGTWTMDYRRLRIKARKV